MGDRANCIVKQENGPDVWLYTHWIGSLLPSIVQSALARRMRWDDPAYLTRIIFDAMTEGQHGEETGFGISTSMQDNEHPLIFVNGGDQTVMFAEEGTKHIKSYSFEEYLALETPDYPD